MKNSIKFFLLFFITNLALGSTAIDIPTRYPLIFDAILQSDVSLAVLRNEVEFKQYVAKNGEELRGSDLSEILSSAQSAQRSLGVPWQLTMCNMYIESKLNKNVTSWDKGMGISQLMDDNLQTIKNITYNSFEKSQAQRCDMACSSNLYEDVDYLSLIMGIKSCNSKNETIFCSNYFRNIYHSKVYKYSYLEYFQIPMDKQIELEMRGETYVTANVSKAKISSKDKFSKYVYPYLINDAVYLSAFNHSYNATEIDHYITQKLLREGLSRDSIRKILPEVISELDHQDIKIIFKFIAAAYNGGLNQIRNTIIYAPFKIISNNKIDFKKLYERFSSPKGFQAPLISFNHAEKISRCTDYFDDRSPHFNSGTIREDLRDSIPYSQSALYDVDITVTPKD